MRVDGVAAYVGMSAGTEAGDAGATTAEIKAASGHKTSVVIDRYVRRSPEQVLSTARKRNALAERRATRTNRASGSE